MLERLSLGVASVSGLGKPLAMSLAAVVQHVEVPEASGLVRSQESGREKEPVTHLCRASGEKGHWAWSTKSL
jgi:hypothetical protein